MPIKLADVLYPPQQSVAPFGLRPDGTAKGKGYWGVLPRNDGGVSTEISVGVEIKGKEMDIPLLVPTLTKKEVEWLQTADTEAEDFFDQLPSSIMEKAIKHAEKRLDEGKGVFADPKELRMPSTLLTE